MKRIHIVLFAIVIFASCNRVSGTYVNERGGLYELIEFVGKTSCTITDIHTHDGAEKKKTPSNKQDSER